MILQGATSPFLSDENMSLLRTEFVIKDKA